MGCCGACGGQDTVKNEQLNDTQKQEEQEKTSETTSSANGKSFRNKKYESSISDFEYLLNS